MAANETPPFWFEKPGLKSWFLSPFSYLYDQAASVNMLAKHTAEVPVPVICIGNFVVGGGGKTPTALALAKAAKEKGFTPGFLSRGYSGKITAATIVDLEKHNASDIGDEPLLLAREALTVVSADRPKGANLLVDQNCDLIIMDDGFQNPKLLKDYCLVVVDSKRGIGNGFSMPAGPLRVSLKDQLSKTDSVLIVGNESGADQLIRSVAKAAKPIYSAATKMVNKAQWRNKFLLPYAGIADPQKFFTSLKDAGADIAQVSPFGDHHFFRNDEIKELLGKAELLGARLVTTAKDHARLIGMGAMHQQLAEKSLVCKISLEFEDETIAPLIIEKAIENFEKRSLAAN